MNNYKKEILNGPFSLAWKWEIKKRLIVQKWEIKKKRILEKGNPLK